MPHTTLRTEHEVEKKAWYFHIPIFNGLFELIRHNSDSIYLVWLTGIVGAIYLKARITSLNNGLEEVQKLCYKGCFLARIFLKKI